MSFMIRGVEPEDLNQLHDLASQFVLLNLPADKSVLSKKIDLSVESFAGNRPVEEAEYLFVVEHGENQKIVASSQIIAKHGTDDEPHLFFRVLQKNHVSEDLGIGFIHKVLRFQEETDGPTEIGGLLVDRGYRRRPEKIGQQISLVRFLYMAMFPDRFMKRVLCELTPPLTEEGRSEFWESLGRRFTGMSYQEADQLSHLNKEFIRKLFPEEDIYLSLLDTKARLVMGQVGESTRPAQYFLEKIGFSYLNEVDPFDGGPHFGADTDKISVFKQSQWAKVLSPEKKSFSTAAIVGHSKDGKFRAMFSTLSPSDEGVSLPKMSMQSLQIKEGEKVCFSTI